MAILDHFGDSRTHVAKSVFVLPFGKTTIYLHDVGVAVFGHSLTRVGAGMTSQPCLRVDTSAMELGDSPAGSPVRVTSRLYCARDSLRRAKC